MVTCPICLWEVAPVGKTPGWSPTIADYNGTWTILHTSCLRNIPDRPTLVSPTYPFHSRTISALTTVLTSPIFRARAAVATSPDLFRVLADWDAVTHRP